LEIVDPSRCRSCFQQHRTTMANPWRQEQEPGRGIGARLFAVAFESDPVHFDAVVIYFTMQLFT